MGVRSGSAYVFTETDGEWEEALLLASDGSEGDRFGNRVAISGDTIVVGASAAFEGGAYVFERDDGVWTEITKLQASDGFDGNQFGNAVEISGDAILVAASLDDESGSQAGAAYYFQKKESNWEEITKIVGSDSFTGDRFAAALAIHGDSAVIVANNVFGPTSIGSAYFLDINRSETTVGTGVGVTPYPEDENGKPIEDAPQVNLEFASVTSGGDTSVIITNTGPPPPGGFEVLGVDGSSTYIDIETTATFEGFVEVCINYSGFMLAVDPTSLSLAHIVEGEWIDITSSNDLVNNILCGLTPSFSFFAIVQVSDPVDLLEDLKTAIENLEAKNGPRQSLTSMVAKVGKLMNKGNFSAASSDLKIKVIKKVEKYRGKHISDAEADDLVGLADGLAAVLTF